MLPAQFSRRAVETDLRVRPGFFSIDELAQVASQTILLGRPLCSVAGSDGLTVSQRYTAGKKLLSVASGVRRYASA